MNDFRETKVVVGPARFSYLHVWEPVAIGEGAEKKYSVSLIIPKSDAKSVGLVKAAIQNALNAGIGSKFGGKKPAAYKNPLRDGDAERPDDEAYKGCYFVNANCRTKPGIVDARRQPITDQDELYSGCYGYASITFYAFNTNGNKGITCGLNNLMKTKDGEPLGGRSTAEADFADIDVPFEAPSNDGTDDLF